MDSRRRTYSVLIGIILLTLPCYCGAILAIYFAPDDAVVVDEDTPPTLPVVVSPTPEATLPGGVMPGTLTAVPTITRQDTRPPLEDTPDQFVTPTTLPTATATSTATSTTTPTATSTVTATSTSTLTAEPPTATATATEPAPPTATETAVVTETPTATPTLAEGLPTATATPTASPTATTTPEG